MKQTYLPRTFARATKLAALAAALAMTGSMAVAAQSNSPWLPIPGSGSVGLSYVTQSGDSAYVMGGMDVPISAITGGAASKFNRNSLGLKVAYGIADRVSVDASFGHAKVKAGAADSSSGLTDTVLGVNVRVLDEYENRSAPTVTLRLAGIINGNYDGARLAALGKDASGYELSLLLGKEITPKFRLWGGVSYEDRNRGVPSATAFDINAGYAVTQALSLSVGYTSKKYGGSLNIAGPGFSPAAFQRVNEQRDTIRLGGSYAIAGNQSVTLSFAKVTGGRNTVKDDRILGLGYTFGF
jgi:hypothetical protein